MEQLLPAKTTLRFLLLLTALFLNVGLFAQNNQAYNTVSVSKLEINLDYNGVMDITKINFNASATTGFDDAYDANKTNGAAGRPTLYTYMPNAGTWYAINTLPLIVDATTVPMGLRPEADGSMTISVKGLPTFDPTTYIFLEDKKTGNWKNLRDGSYTFDTRKTDSVTRFVVHFTPPASILTTDASCYAPGVIDISQPGSVTWNYTLTDTLGAAIASGILNKSMPVTVRANAGIYRLVLKDNNGYSVAKSIIVGGLQPVVAEFATTAINVHAGDTIGFTSTVDAATYSWDFGDGTGSTEKAPIHTYAGDGVYNVSLTIFNNEGCSSTTTKIVTVAAKEVTTGITPMPGPASLPIWSNDNRVYVDFTKESKVEAEIEIYNVLGQLITREKFTGSAIFSREVKNVEAAYMIVKVLNDEVITMKKVFIASSIR